MRSYGKVSPRIWTGRLGHYMRGRHNLQALVLYLATCPHQNLAGIFRLTTGYVRDDTGIDEEQCEKLLGELCEFGYIEWDPKAGIVWVIDHARHELGSKASKQQRVAVARILDDFAISEVVLGFVEKYPEYIPEDFDFDRLSNRVSKFESIPFLSPSPSPLPLPSPFPVTPSPAPPTPSREKGWTPTESAPPGCPHEKIIDLYHETLPELPKIRVWNNQRRSHLKARWREDPERQCLEWWRDFFRSVSESAFLMGRAHGMNSEPFVCSLDWLIKPTNFAKVLEGRYGPRRGKPPEKPDEMMDPHSWERHGIIKNANKNKRWCSRKGGWVHKDEWKPRGPEE